MTFAPIIVRELRAEARRPFNYWLRVLGASAALGFVFLALLPQRDYFLTRGLVNSSVSPWVRTGTSPLPSLGGAIFGNANAALFAAIWLLVPLLTADCISRESREGTLGLLLLTPLTSGQVVVGKCLVHGLRALTLFLAVLPLLCVPLLLGGVSAKDLYMAALLDGSAMVLALAAGLLASVMARGRMQAVLMAEVASAIFALAFMWAHERGFWQTVVAAASASPGPGAAGWWAGRTWMRPQHFRPSLGNGGLTWLHYLFALTTDWGEQQEKWPGFYSSWTAATGWSPPQWSDVWTNCPPGGHRLWLRWVCVMASGSLLVLTLAIFTAAARVRRLWREEPLTERRLEVARTLCAPRFALGLFRRKMRRALERNPIGWLHQYSWSARLTKWGWCSVVLVGEILLLEDLFGAWRGQKLLAALLMFGLAISAAGSFRRERESGLLELLLVAPLRTEQIVLGRIRGIWMQFLPALALMIIAVTLLGNPPNEPFGSMLSAPVIEMLKLALGAYLALPVIGLYCSLRCRHFLTAVLTTISAGILLPAVIAQIAVRLGGWLPLGCLLAFPAIGIYYVLRPRRVLALWTTALLAGLTIASIRWELSLDLDGRDLFWRSLGASTYELILYNLEETRLAVLTVVAQGGAALTCGALLCHNLKRRKFALQLG